MNISIINIGDELLIGQVVNSNASSMSRMLIAAGMEVKEVAVVGDNGDAIRDSLTRCLANSDAVLVTGGLGPTKDDITKTVLCDFFHSHLVENQTALDNVKRIFAIRGFELTPVNRAQALVPECCQVLNNDLGTAPCMWFHADNGKVVVSMPGVPFEMEWLMQNRVVPQLQEHFRTDHIINKNLLVQGIGESFFSDLVEPWEMALPKCIRLAYLPQAGMLKLRLTARGTNRQTLQTAIDKAVDELYPIAGQYIVGEDCETLAELAHKLLTDKGKTLATAESCTGGAIASQFTAQAGASHYFRGGIVAYSNDIKENTLGVKHSTLEQYGAVSEQTAREMVEGVRQLMDSDFAIATTGIAGPDGGTPEKPVGTVWIAVATRTNTETALLSFPGRRRQQNIERSTNQAIAMLIKTIKNN